MNRKLYRTTDGQMIAGVCAGLGKYFEIDPTVIRVLFALLAAFGGGGLLLYILLMIIMPMEPGVGEPMKSGKQSPATTPTTTTSADAGPMDSEAIVSSPTPADEEPIDPAI